MQTPSMQKRANQAIVLLGILLTTAFAYRCAINDCSVKNRILKKFSVPVKLFPASHNEKVRIPNYETTLARRKNAHFFFVQSCSMLDSADFFGAQQYVNQAIAEDPGNKKYQKMARLVMAEIANRKLMNRIQEQVNATNFDQAWKGFVEASRDNYLFFSRYAEEFSYLLKANNQIASSTSILMAISGKSS